MKTLRKINSFVDTVRECSRLSRKYSGDLGAYRFSTIFDCYNYTRNLPYIPDPKGLETQVRPGLALQPAWPGPRDCDDKTTIIAAYCHAHNIPVRACVVGKHDRPHHIYPEVFIQNRWTPADATYPAPRCKFGQRLYDEKFRRTFPL